MAAAQNEEATTMQPANPEMHVDGAERERIAALHALGLLDSQRESEYDQIVELAAAICGTPISSCTLVDEDRQWFKASKGIDTCETGRELSFCSHAIKGTDLMVVEDATKDQRFSDHPWVTGEASVRFYAGMPLPDSKGNLLGTLCVVDTVPRQLTEVQKSALRVLTDQLSARIELTAERQKLKQALLEKEALFQSLQSSEERFRSFMNNGPFLSYIRDEQGRFMFYSNQVARRFGVDTTSWIGKTLADLFPSEDADVYLESDLQAIRSEKPVEVVEETKDECGRSTFWRSFKFGFKDENGRPVIGGISVDITNEVRVKQELEDKGALLERFALTDALTGLANRHMLEKELKTGFRVASEQKQPFSVILMDIDNFKRCNDVHGHSAGDEVLRILGRLLTKSVRSTDLAARYGGEEMIVLLPGASSEQAVIFAERVRANIHAEQWPHGPVTASFGVASFEEGCLDPEMLVAQADEALYQAKRSGKDRVIFAENSSAMLV